MMVQNSPFSSEIDFEYGVAMPLSGIVRRFVANNPGPLTFKGTNVYILGQKQLAIIDPGPDDDRHIEALLRSLPEETITKIILTHTHKDHSGGVKRLQQLTGARTYGFRPSDAVRGAYRQSQDGLAGDSGELACGFADTSFVPDFPLDDGDEVVGDGWSLRVVHTPGHAPDHICYCLVSEKALFTGDHIMPWSTSVIAPPEGSMSDYMTTLATLAGRHDELYYPGHGGRVYKPKRLVRAYVLHRQWRENSILKLVSEGHRSVTDLVPILYNNLDEDLLPAARLSVLAHLEHLAQKGKVQRIEGLGLQSCFAGV